MSVALTTEMGIFVRAVLLGVIFAFVAELMEVFRGIFHVGHILTGVGDFLFWIVLGICLFQLVYQENSGCFRGYIFLALILGALLKKQLKKVWKKVTIIFMRLFWAKEKI